MPDTRNVLRLALVLALAASGGCYKSSMGLRGLAGLGEAMTSGAGGPQTTAEDRFPDQVIDAHVSLEHDRDRLAVHPSSGMEIAFQGAGVVGAVILPTHMDFYPRWEENPRRRLAYCARAGEGVAPEVLTKGFRERKYQCLLVDPVALRRTPDHKSLRPFYDLAGQWKVPVVLTVTRPPSTVGWEETHPRHLSAVLGGYKKLNFVVAYPGTPYLTELASVMDKHPNLHVVTSTFLDGDIFAMTHAQVNERVRPAAAKFLKYRERVLFGSHWPSSKILNYVTLLGEFLGPADRDLVFYENARRIFRMDLPPTAPRKLSGS